MAKKKSAYSIEDPANAPAENEATEPTAQDGGVSLSADDLSQMQQLKSAGDQSGDYSQLGAFVAQLLGGASAAQAPAPEEAPVDDNLRESM